MTLVQALRDDAELRRKQEIHEAEESKNAHIQDLMRKHEKVICVPIPVWLASPPYLPPPYYPIDTSSCPALHTS